MNWNPHSYVRSQPVVNVGGHDIPPFAPLIVTGVGELQGGEFSYEVASTFAGFNERFSFPSPMPLGFNDGGLLPRDRDGMAVLDLTLGVTAAVSEEEAVQERDLLVAIVGEKRLRKLDGGELAGSPSGSQRVGDCMQIHGMFVAVKRLREGFWFVQHYPSPLFLVRTERVSLKEQNTVTTLQGYNFMTIPGGEKTAIPNPLGKTLSFCNIYGRIRADRLVTVGLIQGNLIPITAEC